MLFFHPAPGKNLRNYHKLRFLSHNTSQKPWGHLVIDGNLDNVIDNHVEGWVFQRNVPQSTMMVSLFIDGAFVTNALSDEYREDLKHAGIGDGEHAFRIPIPERYLDGTEHEIDIRVGERQLHNSPLRFVLSRFDGIVPTPALPQSKIKKQTKPASVPAYAGNLDLAEYPEIRGWAWNENEPDKVLSVDIFINGQKVDKVLADEFRTDLENAGIGNGMKAFRVMLRSSLDPSREHFVSAKIANTDTELGGSPRTLNFATAIAPFRSTIERRQGSPLPYTSVTATEKRAAKEEERASLPLQQLDTGKATQPVAELAASRLQALEKLAPPTVIVPIFNAPAEVKDCLEALMRNTTSPCELLLIDDCSTDKAIGKLLVKYEGRPHITILRNEKNLGYTRTVNLGIGRAKHDVVLLNSDTRVTPRWLENLCYAAYRAPNVATVTAISDNSGAFSVPHEGSNVLPDWLGDDRTGRLISAASGGIYPESPTGNGFCMYVKRQALNEIGTFDHHSFPRGYGEENDFCMRAAKAGWKHLVDDSTFVFHTRSASFGEEKQALIETSAQVLREKHPEYKPLVNAFTTSSAMLQMRTRISQTMENMQARHKEGTPTKPDGLPRALYVLHGEATGGTPQTNADLMRSMQGVYDTFVLDCDGEVILLKRYIDGVFYDMEEWILPRKLSPLESRRDDYDAVIFEVLKAYAFELVHIRHLYRHMMSLPHIAKALGIPVLLSLHDFYYVCPSINLVDECGKYCAGICTKSVPEAGKDCSTPFSGVELPPLKHRWVKDWQEKTRAILPYADAFVTTCLDAKNLYIRTFPEMKQMRFEVIEHGRDFKSQKALARKPQKGKPLRILIPGQLTPHKGADFIAELIAIDKQQKKSLLEFHLLGHLPARYRHLGEWHGTYRREEFYDRVAATGCHLVGIFSSWAETYSHTLSEAWACGLPVVASHYGALGERIRAHGGGWLLDIEDPQEAYATLHRIAEDPKAYSAMAAQASTSNLRTTKQMAEDYAVLYASLLEERRVFI